MQLLIYASADSIAGLHLLSEITPLTMNKSINFFYSLDDLARHLRNPICVPLLAVLLPKDHKELSVLIQMRHLLRNTRIVLVLPNSDEKTISDSHLLRPRYVGHSDGNLSDVVAVITKMTRMEKGYLRQTV